MAVNLDLHIDPPSLRADETGAIHVGPSRVSLDVVVAEYDSGMTPEDIVREYDTLNLADVHAAIAYYLRHSDDVRDYIQQRQQESQLLKATIQKQQASFPTKDELVERKRKKQRLLPHRQSSTN